MKVWIGGLMIGLAALTPGAAWAGPCDAVKKEMAFGEAAAEDAKDALGFKRAMDQFTEATKKAPDCQQAFFNLGVVAEQAGEHEAAKSAYQRYLKLSPKAADKDAVEKKLLKLEYRLTLGAAEEKRRQEEAEEQAKEELARKLNGRWRAKLRDQPGCGSKKGVSGLLIEFEVRTRVDITGRVVGASFSNGCDSYFVNVTNRPVFMKGYPKDGEMRGWFSDIIVRGYNDMNAGKPALKSYRFRMAEDGNSFTLEPLFSGKLPLNIYGYYERN